MQKNPIWRRIITFYYYLLAILAFVNLIFNYSFFYAPAKNYELSRIIFQVIGIPLFLGILGMSVFFPIHIIMTWAKAPFPILYMKKREFLLFALLAAQIGILFIPQWSEVFNSYLEYLSD